MLTRLKDFAGSAGLHLTLTALFWAGNTVAGRLAVGEVSLYTLVFLRWIMVIAALWPFYGGEVREKWGEIRPRLGRLVMMGALGFTGFNALYYYAAYHTSAINMGLLQGAVPAFVLIGAFFAHGVRPTPLQVIGVTVTALGVAVIATQGAPLKIVELAFNRGDVALIVACIFYSFYTIALKDRPQMSGVAFFTFMALISAITSIPLLIYEGLTTGLNWPTPKGWAIIVWVAIFPSCLAQLFYLSGVDKIGPGRAGVFVNLVPVFSSILAVWLIDEPFAMFHAVALALVIGGIVLAQRSGR